MRPTKAESKFCTTVYGELSVMIHGTSTTLKLCADNLAFPMLSQPSNKHILAEAVEIYGWMRYIASEPKRLCNHAHLMDGETTTAATAKMPESFAETVIALIFHRRNMHHACMQSNQ